MTIVLVLVAIGWVAYLGFWLKERMGARHGDSVLSFRNQLTTLERRVGPARRGLSSLPFSGSGMSTVPSNLRRAPRVSAPVSARQAAMRKRRRDVLFTLAGAFAFTLLLVAMAPGPITGVLCFLAAASLGAFVFLLVQAERIAAERRSKVTYLEPRRSFATGMSAGGTSDLLLRRSATN